MKTALIKSLILLITPFLITSCNKVNVKKDVPFCIKQKIRKIKREGVQNPPAKVYEWKTDTETYYYITSGCCDQYNYLYDEKCNEVCAPDGGFSGMGSGDCPEFSSSPVKTLIWEDERKYN